MTLTATDKLQAAVFVSSDADSSLLNSFERISRMASPVLTGTNPNSYAVYGFTDEWTYDALYVSTQLVASGVLTEPLQVNVNNDQSFAINAVISHVIANTLQTGEMNPLPAEGGATIYLPVGYIYLLNPIVINLSNNNPLSIVGAGGWSAPQGSMCTLELDWLQHLTGTSSR